MIDLNKASPAWRQVQSMQYARRHLNATLLPTGEVLVTGGTSASGFNNPAGGVHAAELWNPETEKWTTLASNQVTRVYHSTSLLLLDGRVLHSGSGRRGAGRPEPGELRDLLAALPVQGGAADHRQCAGDRGLRAAVFGGDAERHGHHKGDADQAGVGYPRIRREPAFPLAVVHATSATACR